MTLIATATSWYKIPEDCRGCLWSGPFFGEPVLWLLNQAHVSPRCLVHGQFAPPGKAAEANHMEIPAAITAAGDQAFAAFRDAGVFPGEIDVRDMPPVAAPGPEAAA